MVPAVPGDPASGDRGPPRRGPAGRVRASGTTRGSGLTGSAQRRSGRGVRIRQLVLGAASDSRVFKNWCLRISRPVSEVKSREKRDEQSAAWRPSLGCPVGGHPRAGPHSTPPPCPSHRQSCVSAPNVLQGTEGDAAFAAARWRRRVSARATLSPRAGHSPPRARHSLPRASLLLRSQWHRHDVKSCYFSRFRVHDSAASGAFPLLGNRHACPRPDSFSSCKTETLSP